MLYRRVVNAERMSEARGKSVLWRLELECGHVATARRSRKSRPGLGVCFECSDGTVAPSGPLCPAVQTIAGRTWRCQQFVDQHPKVGHFFVPD